MEISNRLLSYNKGREPKEIKSAAKGRAIVKIQNKKSGLSSIEATMKLLHTLLDDKRYSQVALIGRRQISLFPYQVLLSAEGTSYYVDTDLDIFDGEAMQSLQNIIQIVYRAKDEDVDDPADALLTICDKIDRFQLQKKERQKIYNYIDGQNVNTFSDALEALSSYPEMIKKTSPAIICSIIDQLINAPTVYQFMELCEKNLEGLDKDYRKKDVDTHYKEPQFFRLREISRRYGDDFRRFYRDIEKARKAGERCRAKGEEDTEEGYKEINNSSVFLLTATRSKGREFDAVIVLDSDDNEWPNHLSNDMEEERRLFYVALSRAKKFLCFVVSSEREGSRFLLEARLI